MRLSPALIFLLFFAGCDPDAPTAAPQRREKIQILATVYPLAEMAQRIGGEFAEVQWLCETGQRPQEIEATKELRQRANKAAMVITSGPWDTWAAAELSAEARTARLVEPERMFASADTDPRAFQWLSPPVMKEMVEAVRLRLTLLDPAHEAVYRQRANAYQAEVDALERELNDGLAKGVGVKVIATRATWTTLCRRYGVAFMAPVDVPEEKLTANDFKEISSIAKANKRTLLYIDAATPAAIRQAIEQKTGLKTVTLDALGSSAPDGRSTWAKILRYDIEQLRKSWE